jgi:hypothetical protein
MKIDYTENEQAQNNLKPLSNKKTWITPDVEIITNIEAGLVSGGVEGAKTFSFATFSQHYYS